MTRAEYEAKYGSAPKPAPVVMTRAQYQAKYGSAPAATPAAAPQNSLFSRIKTGVTQSFAERDKKVSEATTRAQQGKQSKASGIFQAIGQTAGLAGDAAFTAVKEGVRTVAPSAIPAVKKTVAAVLQTKPVQKAAEAYGGFKQKNPTAAANIEAAVNIGGIVPIAGASPAIAKGAAKASKVGVKGASKAATATGKAVKEAVPEVAPFKKSFRSDIAKEFEQEGITAPVSAISDSPFVQGAEAVAAKSAFGRKIVDQVQTAQSAIEQRTNAVVERIKPVKTISDENLGKTIQEGMREYEHNFKVTEEKVYQTFAKQYGTAETGAVGTKQVLQEIIAQQGKDYLKGVNPRFSGMLDRLTGETPEVKRMRAEGLPEAVIAKSRNTPPLTFEELKATRTSVGEELARNPDDSSLKRIYGALTQDMKSAVDALEPFDSKGSEALRKLDADYASGKKLIEGRIAQSIEQSNPERIAQNLITRNSAQTLRTLKDMIGVPRFEEISKTFLRQALDTSVTRGKFDVEKLKKTLSTYDKETLAEVLNPQQLGDLEDALQKLEKYQRLGTALKKGAKYTEGSQTAFLQNITGTGARVAAFATAVASGNASLAVGILFGTVAEAAYAKLFTSPLGRRFLTSGIGNPETSRKVGDYLKQGRVGRP